MSEPGRWFLFTARDADEAVAAAVANGSDDLILEVIHDPDRHGIGPGMRDVFEQHPNLEFYGWLADDTFPRTAGWDRILGDATKRFGLAYAADGGVIPTGALETGSDMSSGLCWSGELVRAAGWWAFPGLEAAWIDVIWMETVTPLGLHRYRPDVLVEHRSWRNGTRQRDDVDNWSQRTIDRDATVYWNVWKSCQETTIERVRYAIVNSGASGHPAPLPLAR